MDDRTYKAQSARIDAARTKEEADALTEELKAIAPTDGDARDLLQQLHMTRTARGI